MAETLLVWNEGYTDAIEGREPKHKDAAGDPFIEAYIRGYRARKAYEANPPKPHGKVK